MGYTISWEPLRFTDFTYATVLSVVSRVISCRMRVEHCGFLIGEDDDSCVAFARDGIQTPWEKTNRMPYTKEAMKALIVMVEYGVTENLDHDDSNMAWYLEALDAVHAKHPLVSYEQQRQYFVNLETSKRAMS